MLTPSPRPPLIVLAEWLSNGVMIHFEEGVPAFFTSQFLSDHRDEQPVPELPEDE